MTKLRMIITEGTLGHFRIEDDEGLHEVDVQVTGEEHGLFQVSPTHWLGENHLVLERFKVELGAYIEAEVPDGPAVEEWAAEYITAVMAKLSGDLWLIWKGVIAE